MASEQPLLRDRQHACKCYKASWDAFVEEGATSAHLDVEKVSMARAIFVFL